jgi:hypothetical protein
MDKLTKLIVGYAPAFPNRQKHIDEVLQLIPSVQPADGWEAVVWARSPHLRSKPIHRSKPYQPPLRYPNGILVNRGTSLGGYVNEALHHNQYQPLPLTWEDLEINNTLIDLMRKTRTGIQMRFEHGTQSTAKIWDDGVYHVTAEQNQQLAHLIQNLKLPQILTPPKAYDPFEL